jgi:hypothetical protein
VDESAQDGRAARPGRLGPAAEAGAVLLGDVGGQFLHGPPLFSTPTTGPKIITASW